MSQGAQSPVECEMSTQQSVDSRVTLRDMTPDTPNPTVATGEVDAAASTEVRRSRGGGGGGGTGHREGKTRQSWQTPPPRASESHRDRCMATSSSPFPSACRGTAPMESSQDTRLTLVFDEVSAAQGKKKAVVLSNAMGIIKSGRVTALVNCGGSSHADVVLLNILAGEETANHTGTVLCNGTPVVAPSFRHRRALLDQDFTMFENLTVWQNLEYAAAMRVAGAAKRFTVVDIVRQLLLDTVQDTKVKNCNLYVRRRVSLGKELLLNPAAIFLDQALQGLPTHEAQHFLGLLHHIARPTYSREPSGLFPSCVATAAESVAVTSLAAKGVTSASLVNSQDYGCNKGSGGGTGSEGSASSVSSHNLVSMTSQDTKTVVPVTRSVNRDSWAQSNFDRPTQSTAPRVQADGAPLSPKGSTAAYRSEHESFPVSTGELYAGDAVVPMAEETGLDPACYADRIVVLSMIQPRWALLKHVDDVILLEGSHCVFCGSLRDLLLVISKHVDASSVTRNGAVASPVSSVAASTALSSKTRDGLHKVAFTDPSAAIAALLGCSGLVEKSINALYRMSTESPVISAEEITEEVVGSDPEPPGARQRAADVTPLQRTLQVTDNKCHVQRKVDAFLQECASGLHTLDSSPPSPPNPVVQLLYLCKYALLQIRGNLIVYGSMFILLAALALTLTAIYTSQEGQSGMQNRIGIMFFLISSTVLHSILTVDTRRKEFLSFQRHRTHGYHSTTVYMCYCILSVAFVRVFICSAFTFVVFLLSNIGKHWMYYSQVMQLALVVGILSFCSYFVVLFVVSVTRTLRIATFILFALYTLNLLLAGLILNLNTLPRVIRSLSYSSIIRLAYESAILTQFMGEDFGCVDTAPINADPRKFVIIERESDMRYGLTAHVTCYTGAEYAQFLGFNPAREWINVGILGGIAGGFVLLCFIAWLVYHPPRNYAN